MVALLPQLSSLNGTSNSSSTSSNSGSTAIPSFALDTHDLVTLSQAAQDQGSTLGTEVGDVWTLDTDNGYKLSGSLYHSGLAPVLATNGGLAEGAAGSYVSGSGNGGIGDSLSLDLGVGGLGFGEDLSSAVEHAGMVSVSYIALFSTLFCIVGLVGMAGNVLVVYIVLTDKKMRKSVTNLLILNLAVADSLLMVFGVPEIVQFMLDRGWLLGLTACKINRSVLVAALYASVLTLVAVCIER
jgi:hypothetical protein